MPNGVEMTLIPLIGFWKLLLNILTDDDKINTRCMPRLRGLPTYGLK